MQEFISQFHFLRPLWLLAIIPVGVLALLLWQQKRRSGYWHQYIQADLLQHLLEQHLGKSSRWQLAGLLSAWLIACIALAGPSWQLLPQTVHKSEAAVVILYDMSPSMVAEDIKPSRLQRAQFKLRDYLSRRQDGLTALLAYAGDAHVVSPLTDDTGTIINLVPALHPGMMPMAGSNVEAAVERALRLFLDAGVREGEILLVTDGVAEEAIPQIEQLLTDTRFRLSILGVGTVEGAPIPTGDGGFIRSHSNDIVIAQLNQRELRRLSGKLGGTYAQLRSGDNDIELLLAHTERQEMLSQQQRLVERDFDIWRDNGRWLAVLLLPFAVLAFRRGWLLSLGAVGILSMAMPEPALAQDWQDLWLRSDQQGLRHLEQGDPEAAANAFKRHDWRGSALYRNDDFDAAAEAFSQGDTAQDHYNRGNALAKGGRLQEALDAYESALTQQPDFPDAAFNAELVRELLEQQSQGQNADDSDDQDDTEQQGQPEQGEGDADGETGEEQASDGGGTDSDEAESNDTGDQDGDTQVDEQAAQELADRQADPEVEPGMDESLGDQPNEEQDNADQQELPDVPSPAEPSSAEDRERQQALEQWLRQVPDDPSGLLRRKFEYEHRRQRQQQWGADWMTEPETPGPKRW